MSKKEVTVKPSVGVNVEPVAVQIDVAALMLGLSRRGFYIHFIDAHRVHPVYLGTRAMIDVTQLRAAWQAFASDPQNAKRLTDPDSE